MIVEQVDCCDVGIGQVVVYCVVECDVVEYGVVCGCIVQVDLDCVGCVVVGWIVDEVLGVGFVYDEVCVVGWQCEYCVCGNDYDWVQFDGFDFCVWQEMVCEFGQCVGVEFELDDLFGCFEEQQLCYYLLCVFKFDVQWF